MGHLSRSLEDSSAERNVDCGGLLKKFQKGAILATGLETILLIF